MILHLEVNDKNKARMDRLLNESGAENYPQLIAWALGAYDAALQIRWAPEFTLAVLVPEDGSVTLKHLMLKPEDK